MPLISVIIPFHNRLDWTCQAIDSVLSQTMQDFEILLIDDGSSEDLSPLSNYLKNKKITYLRQENKGPASARNYGMERACGIFIAFLDSDDLFFPNKLERQLLYMQPNPLISLSHTSYDRIDQNSKYIETMHSGSFTGKVYPEIYIQCPIATPTVMIRRSVIVDINIRFDEGISIAEDLLFWTKIAKQSEILGIDEPLTKVRIHSTNVFFDNQKQIVGFKNIVHYGIECDRHIEPFQRKELLAKCYAIISSLYFTESDFRNSWKYSHLAIKESFSIWVKMAINVRNIRRLLKKLPGLESVYRHFKSIWQKR
jgi:glycosyltransferase involved in cell wall biosynthesis